MEEKVFGGCIILIVEGVLVKFLMWVPTHRHFVRAELCHPSSETRTRDNVGNY